MPVTDVMFYLLSVLLVVNASLTVLAYNSVFSLIFLIMCFILSSCMLFLLECEFLAILLIVIYVGAIAVLLLFAVMMLDLKRTDLSKNTLKYLPISITFIFLTISIILYQILDYFGKNLYLPNNFYCNYYLNWYDAIDKIYDIDVYGQIYILMWYYNF